MKHPTLTLAIAVATIGAATGPQSTAGLDYEVTAVKRTLVLETADGERQLGVGDHARSGDLLWTGSRSKAELAVSERSARFVIGSKTRFRLADDQPGVLLEIERGSVRGIFGALVGDDDRERLVTTPSAVLAVRGTDYGVEVEKDGDTSVAVFEGIVEVRDTAGVGEAVRVLAGQSVRIRRGRAAGRPAAHELSSGDWDRGRRVRTQAPGGPGGSQGMGRPGQPGGGPPASSPQGGSKRPGG